MHPVKLLERAASTAVHAMRHPISSAAYTTGVARGLVGVAFRGVAPGGHDAPARPESAGDTGPRPVPTQRAAEPQTTTAPPEPQRVPKPVPEIDELPEPIVIEPEDEDPGEAFATEPKAVSRESAHGGGTASDAEIDEWVDQAMARGDDVDVETPVGTAGADVGHHPDTAEAGLQQPGTQPVLDPGTAKAILKEAETLRKAGQREPE